MPNLGRNDPCHCNSGKKYKKCCLAIDELNHLKLTDSDYMLAHASEYPIHQCLIDITEGLATIIIIRKIVQTDRFIFIVYLMDIFCLGLKETFGKGNVDSQTINEFLDKYKARAHISFQEIEYEKAREIVLGGIAYAKNLGFEPHPDWEFLKYGVEYHKPCKITFQFGKNGKPCFISGPNDNVPKILEKLEGKDFDYFIQAENREALQNLPPINGSKNEIMEYSNSK